METTDTGTVDAAGDATSADGATGDSADADASDGDPTVGSGEVGAACQSDADCGPSAPVCLQSAVPGPSGYCSHPCAVADDCLDLLATVDVVDVSGELGAGYNDWGSDVLTQAVGCADGGSVGGPSGDHCVVLCPERSAARWDADGPYACRCLPNFSDVDPGDVQDCQWNGEVECSLFQGCTAINTAAAECSAGDFQCVVHEGLEGLCFDFVSGAQIEACVLDCAYDCDPECIAGCAGNGGSQSALEGCTAACCTSDNPACG